MKCLDGELHETKYEWPEDSDKRDQKEMVQICQTGLKKNEVCYINGKHLFLLHQSYKCKLRILSFLKIRLVYIALKISHIQK